MKSSIGSRDGELLGGSLAACLLCALPFAVARDLPVVMRFNADLCGVFVMATPVYTLARVRIFSEKVKSGFARQNASKSPAERLALSGNPNRGLGFFPKL